MTDENHNLAINTTVVESLRDSDLGEAVADATKNAGTVRSRIRENSDTPTVDHPKSHDFGYNVGADAGGIRHDQALWRSLDELSQTPEFIDYLHREFPRQASEWTDPNSRRSFLQLMAASLGLALRSAGDKFE